MRRLVMAATDTCRQSWVKQRVKFTLVLAALAFGVLAHQYKGTLNSATGAGIGGAEAQKDDAGARASFQAAYKVFMHPRCMNCHPAGDVPLQGDDSHLHTQNVKRGPDGKAKYALKCANCHQETNL